MIFKTLGPLFDFDMMFIILLLCLLMVLLHSVKQLLLLSLDHGGDFIESFVEAFLAIRQLELNLGEDILCVFVFIIGFLMDELSELVLQDLDLVSETTQHRLLD